jgi:hypothetical protein
LELYIEKASGMKKTDAAWFADIFKSGTTFELLVTDEGSRQTILRGPVDLADASSVINVLRGAFDSFGSPAELRTDGAATFFASALFCDLMHSCGISHTIMRSPAQKALAERLVRNGTVSTHRAGIKKKIEVEEVVVGRILAAAAGRFALMDVQGEGYVQYEPQLPMVEAAHRADIGTIGGVSTRRTGPNG